MVTTVYSGVDSPCTMNGSVRQRKSQRKRSLEPKCRVQQSTHPPNLAARAVHPRTLDSGVMPPPLPVSYATLSHSLASKPYILHIHPSPTSPNLLLRHPSPSLTIADSQSLKPIGTLVSHEGDITAIASDSGALWTGGKDGLVLRWDERARTAVTRVEAVVRRRLPVLSVAISESDYTLMGGTEVVSSESHILFWCVSTGQAELTA